MMIKWLEDAIFDLQALRQYITQEKPSAANRVAKKILSNVNHLLTQPNMGRPGRISGTSELIVANTPYIIAYRIKNNTIEILRVIHVAMQWPEEM